MSSAFSKILVPASLLVVGLIAALILSEGVLRVLRLGFGSIAHVSHQTLHHVHPPNYRFPFFSRAVPGGGHVVYFGPDGYRTEQSTTDENSLSDPINDLAQMRIALMGDSFVVGKEVPDGKTFIGRMQLALSDSAIVKNFGVSSYSPSLYYLQWEREISAFRPTHVFLLLFSNDVTNDHEYLQHAKFSESGQLQAIPGPHISTLGKLLNKSHVYCALRNSFLKLSWALTNWSQSTPEYSIGGSFEEFPIWGGASAEYTESLARAVERSGAKFFLSVVPSKLLLSGGRLPHGAKEFSPQVREWAHQTKIHFVDLTPNFKAAAITGTSPFFVHDIHFNELGHKLTAEAFLKHLRDERPNDY